MEGQDGAGTHGPRPVVPTPGVPQIEYLAPPVEVHVPGAAPAGGPHDQE